MEIGIIAEGRGDCAVLSNILQGILGIDAEDIRFLRPEFSLDNTDKATYQMTAEEFSSWTLVKKDCEEQFKLEQFINSPTLGDKYIVIQIDTAECEEKGYDIERPAKNLADYCDRLVQLVKDKIDEWLNNDNKWDGKILYAICVEETEAWIHTLYENRDTSKPLDAKTKFNSYLNRLRKQNKKFDRNYKRLPQNSEFDRANFLSQEFRKLKTKHAKQVFANNVSLNLFVLSVQALKNK